MTSGVLDTAFTRALGLRLPIVQAPMGGVAGPRLVAAVAEAGALGVLPIWAQSTSSAGAAIEATRTLTAAPFAVNLRADLRQDDHIAIAVDHGVRTIHLFWGDPGASAATIRRLGGRLIATVSDAETAKAALDAGAIALIAQGVEAGGHVFGTTPLTDLLALVADLAGDVPVVAAGGLATADDAVRAFALGASGVAFGTRFVACDESEAHAGYKAALIEARDGGTELTLCFDGFWPGAPHRVLTNSTLRAWNAAGRPPPGERPGEGDAVLSTPDGRSIRRYSAAPASSAMSGDIEASALYAGTGVGHISDVVPAATFVGDVAERLRAALTA